MASQMPNPSAITNPPTNPQEVPAYVEAVCAYIQEVANWATEEIRRRVG